MASIEQEADVRAQRAHLSRASWGPVALASRHRKGSEDALAVVQSPFEGGCCHVQYFGKVTEPVEVDGEEYQPQDVLQLEKDVYPVHLESCNGRVEVNDSTPELLLQSFGKVGLYPLIGENDNDLELFEKRSDFGSEDESDLSDFLVDDDEVDEPFQHSPNDSDFARDTHAAVREFEDWEPETPALQNVKRFVRNLAARAEHANEDARMRTGLPPAGSYVRPCL